MHGGSNLIHNGTSITRQTIFGNNQLTHAGFIEPLSFARRSYPLTDTITTPDIVSPLDVISLLETDQVGNTRPITGRVTSGAVEYGLVGINEIDFIINPVISPNPANNTFNISFTLTEANFITIELIDVMGASIRNIFEGYVSDTLFSNDVDVIDIAQGVYYLKIIIDSNYSLMPVIIQ